MWLLREMIASRVQVRCVVSRVRVASGCGEGHGVGRCQVLREKESRSRTAAVPQAVPEAVTTASSAGATGAVGSLRQNCNA